MKKVTGTLKVIASDRYLMFGCVGIVFLLFIAFAAPLLTNVSAQSFKGESLLPPGSDGHPLGTNHLGQDVYSMLVYGTRTSLKVGLVSVTLL